MFMRVGKIFLSLFFGLLIIFSVSFWGISNLFADDETITVEMSVPSASYCGDGVCDPDESCGSCPADCGSCSGGDTTDPTIIIISTSTNFTTGTVLWTASDGSGVRSCSFEYGEDESYGSSVNPTNIGSSYVANLSGMSPSTIYYFKITCVDNSNNSNSGSKTGDLITLDEADVPPGVLLLNIVSTSTSFTTATIAWTAISAEGVETCSFVYGTNLFAVDPAVDNNNYTVNLSGLSVSTTYNFIISCKSNDNIYKSLESYFTTKFSDITKVPVDLTVLARPEKRGESNNSIGGLLVFYDPIQKIILDMKQIDIDNNGFYRNSEAQLPEYNNMEVFLKGRSHLAKKIIGVDVAEDENLILNFTDATNLNFGNFKLKAGDVQGSWPGLKDNFVDVLDLSAVDVRLNNLTDFDADLNNDSIVDVLDMSMVLGNFNLGGDVLP